MNTDLLSAIITLALIIIFAYLYKIYLNKWIMKNEVLFYTVILSLAVIGFAISLFLGIIPFGYMFAFFIGYFFNELICELTDKSK